jgi:hypothetical protein
LRSGGHPLVVEHGWYSSEKVVRALDPGLEHDGKRSSWQFAVIDWMLT